MKIFSLASIMMAMFVLSLGLSQAQTNKLNKLKGKMPTGKSKAKALPALVYDRPFPTAVMYSSFMNHMSFNENGTLVLDMVSVVFPPDKDVKGEKVNYSLNRFHVKIMKGEQEMADKKYAPQYSYDNYIKFKCDESGEEACKITLTEGNYQLNFLMDDDVFTIIPFEVYKLVNDDPYAKVKAKFYVKGPWNEYAFLKWSEQKELSEGEEHKLYFSAFYKIEDMERKFRQEVKVYSEIFRNGKYLATTGRDQHTLNNYWEMHDVLFYKVPTNTAPNTNKILRKNDLIDGKYQIKNYADGKLRVFNFEVKDSKIVMAGRQVREGTDSKYFIEGFNSTWWLQEESGKYLK